MKIQIVSIITSFILTIGYCGQLKATLISCPVYNKYITNYTFSLNLDVLATSQSNNIESCFNSPIHFPTKSYDSSFVIECDTQYNVFRKIGPIHNIKRRVILKSIPLQYATGPTISWSKDDKLAICTNTLDHSSIQIIDLRSDSILSETNFKDKVDDIAWLGNSNLIAILHHKSKTSFYPHHLFLLLTGHPVDYSKFTLEIRTIDGKIIATKEIKDKVKLGLGRIAYEE